LLCDNPKTIVLRRHAYGEASIVYIRSFSLLLSTMASRSRYARRIALKPKARPNDFIDTFESRSSFRYKRSSPIPLDVVTATREASTWIRQVASQRIHATLKERPAVHLFTL